MLRFIRGILQMARGKVKLAKPNKRAVRRIVLEVERLEERWVPADVRWVGAAGGGNLNWTAPGNWDTGAPPTAIDTAIFSNDALIDSVVNANFTIAGLTIGSTYTQRLTLNSNLTVTSAANQGGGTLTGAGTFTIAGGGTFTWSGGTMSAGGAGNHTVISVNATMNIISADEKILDARNLINNGVVTWSTPAGAIDSIIKLRSALIRNENGSQFNVVTQDQGTGRMFLDEDNQLGSQFIVSAGATFRAGASTRIYTPFANSGAVDIQAEAILFWVHRDSSWTGSCTIAQGRSLDLVGGLGRTHTFNNGASVTGAGTVVLANTVVDVFGGVVTVENMRQESDRLQGNGELRITGTFSWTGGAWQGTGAVRIMPNARLNIVGPAAGAAIAVSMNGRTLENDGIVTWTGLIDINVSNAAAINNNANAIFDVRTDRNITDGGMAGAFTNRAGATLRKTEGAGRAVVEIPSNPNAGTIQQQRGRIQFTRPVQNQGMVELNGGNLEATAGFIQDSGTVTISQGDSLEVTGNLEINGGTVTDNGTLAVTGTVTQSGGDVTIGLDKTLSVTSAYTLSGGTVTTAGGFGTHLTVGALQQSGGTLTLVMASQFTATGGLQMTGGVLNGGGFITADVTNSGGEIFVGGDGTYGGLSITGKFTQTGSGFLNMDLFGSNGADHLHISDVATFGGTLKVRGSGFGSGPFDLIDWTSSYSGSFVLDLPGLPYGAWSWSYIDPANHFTLRWEYGAPLLFAGEGSTQSDTPDALTSSSLQPVVAEAVARWRSALGDAAADRLAGVEISILDLPGLMLGLTSGSRIWIDQNAAGHGWFIDATPGDDVEFATALGLYASAALPGTVAAERVDLLSVLIHETGHALGFAHSDEGVMQETLALGVRHPFGCGCAACAGAVNFVEAGSPVLLSESATSAAVPAALLGGFGELFDPDPRYWEVPTSPALSSAAPIYPIYDSAVGGLVPILTDDYRLADDAVADGGDDVLIGGDGDSLLIGAAGRDVLIGGF